MARTTEQLEREIMREMRKAMNQAAKNMKKDMEKGTEYFYHGGKPKVYVRTGALGETPKTTPVVESGSSMEFDAYLDKNYTYNSGDSPNMGQVLDLANYGNPWMTSSGEWANPTVGQSGFWEKSLEDMEKSLDDAMSAHFIKG